MASDDGQVSGNAWGDDISDERKVELAAQLQAWEADHGTKRGPFQNEKLTGAEVFWLAARALGVSADEVAIAERRVQLLQAKTDFSARFSITLSSLRLEGANLSETHLEGAELAGAHLKGVNLLRAHLEGADLYAAHLEGADLTEAHLEGANLSRAHLERTDLRETRLERADLTEAHLEGAHPVRARLEGAALRGAQLERADLTEAHLEGADLTEAHLEGADLTGALAEGANLVRLHLEGADLYAAHLEGANLARAHLEGANLIVAHLERTDLSGAHLAGADLTRATLNNQTVLNSVVLTDKPHWYSALAQRIRHQRHYGPVRLADVLWNDADLTGVDWSGLKRLGDERGESWWWRSREESEQATRANIQLSKRLRDAGLNDDADRFAYRAQVCQRGVYLFRVQLGRWLFSLLLAALAGYGYRLERVFITYALTVTAFALLYLSVGIPGGFPAHTSPLVDAFQVSITAIHGRVFFEQLKLGSALAWVAASESIIGILIEAVFTGLLIQRFFAR